MAIKTLKPSVGTLAPRLKRYAPGNEAERSQYRDDTQHWRKWYKTARWQKLRMSVLVRDLFTCQMCGKLEPNTSKLVADHRIPHRGSEYLFWKDTNIQCVCKTCHDSEKQKRDRRHR